MTVRWMEVMQRHELSMEGATHEEYELHDVQLGSRDGVTV